MRISDWSSDVCSSDLDEEGRYIEARFGNLSVVSFYIPSGSSGELRQGFKFEAMDWLGPTPDQWLTSGRDYVLCGDWNLVRRGLDIKHWKSNKKNSVCLPPDPPWRSEDTRVRKEFVGRSRSAWTANK